MLLKRDSALDVGLEKFAGFAQVLDDGFLGFGPGLFDDQVAARVDGLGLCAYSGFIART